jgi:hypothetical protein
MVLPKKLLSLDDSACSRRPPVCGPDSRDYRTKMSGNELAIIARSNMTSSASTLFRPLTNDSPRASIALPPQRPTAFPFPALGAIPNRRGVSHRDGSVGHPEAVFDAAVRTNA